MPDVSKRIIAGECMLNPYLDMIQVTIHGQHGWWLTETQARDLCQALQMWIERNAEVE